MLDPTLEQYLEYLTKYYGMDELETLCFRLGINSEDIKGSSREAKARNLLWHLEHRKRLPELTAKLEQDPERVNQFQEFRQIKNLQVSSLYGLSSKSIIIEDGLDIIPQPPSPSLSIPSSESVVAEDHRDTLQQTLPTLPPDKLSESTITEDHADDAIHIPTPPPPTTRLDSGLRSVPMRVWVAGALVITVVALWIALHEDNNGESSGQTPQATRQVSTSGGIAETNSPINANTQIITRTITLPGSEIQAEQVYVPAGSFKMGSLRGAANESLHDVTLDAFWIDRTEVSNEQFDAFVRNTEYRTTAELAGSGDTSEIGKDTEGANWRYPQGPGSSLEGLDKHPVVQVSWDDAVAYCAWAGGRLPTEAEWEYTARGSESLVYPYPWGHEFEIARLNSCDNECSSSESSFTFIGSDGYASTAPVGTYPDGASPVGALDMAGNVWEWVNDRYRGDYYIWALSANPVGPELGELRVLRGGAWDNGAPDFFRSANRAKNLHDNRKDNVGFRCAFDNSEIESQATEVTATEIAPQAGSVRIVPRGRVETLLVFVPAGSFMMGNPSADKSGLEGLPLHEVTLDAFWIDAMEVTNEHYAACVDAGECTPPSEVSSVSRAKYYGNANYAHYPVIYVSWHDANQYCMWAGGRLPTEAEWEYTAHGRERRRFPWVIDDEQSSCDLLNYGDCVGDTAHVGSHPDGSSWVGALDMFGNVSEWVSDKWDLSGTYGQSPEENPSGPATGEYRVQRGDSFSDNEIAPLSYRLPQSPDRNFATLGFRCVQE